MPLVKEVISIMIDRRLEREIEHGKKIKDSAGEIWNWETPAGKIRWARRVRMLTSHIKPGMNVLEIGYGTGYFTKELAKTKGQIAAIDISPDLLEVAKDKVKDACVTFKEANAYDLSFYDECFDTVVGSSILHHLEIDKALEEIYRVLKSNGTVYFTEPNMMNPQIAIQKNISYIKEKLGDSPDEKAFFRWSIKKKLQRHGFKKIQIETFDFLHPQIPEGLLPFLKKFCSLFETIPFLKEIAGSLYIIAVK